MSINFIYSFICFIGKKDTTELIRLLNIPDKLGLRDEPRVLPLQSEVSRAEDFRREDPILEASEVASCVCQFFVNVLVF